ncbi:D-arabinono-1,4-lactone oxidase-domain-containing protein [Roridomyces roridus]|uniref:D-arabinono-1,4-lactone oxidase n=1 Tax=Roridomyces roridus TaxID=1738132 RepID=A0AAD7FEM5_9AGAR|nr:D-arabinono-1,4-lactone oxidase-domain-containing protein [Roridomyces roridus]
MELQNLPRLELVRLLEPIAEARAQQSQFTNWGRTFSAHPQVVFHPRTVTDCRLALELARRDARVLRPVGIGHSPSDLACTDDYMLNMTSMNRVLRVDTEKCFVEAEAGIILTDLHAALEPYGLAMRNLGSISDQTLAGIVTTCTHGSGINFPVLSAHVLALTLVLPATNTVVRCSRTENSDLFEATICGLGATGVILTITLELERAFRLKDVHTMCEFDDVLQDLDTIKRSGEHVRLWWFPAIDRVRVSVANRTTEPKRNPKSSWLWDSLIGFHVLQFLLLLTRLARYSPAPPSSLFERLHPLRLFSRTNVLVARLACWLAGPTSITVDDSHRVFNIECRYRQHTTEWAIPSSAAPTCLSMLQTYLKAEQEREGGERPHFPIEVRWSSGDNLWLSPAGDRGDGGDGETCWIGIVVFKPYNLPTRYRAMFTAFEDIMTRHGGRPHWAKAHHLTPEKTRTLYPQLERFVRVVREADPEGLVRNEYVGRHLGIVGAERLVDADSKESMDLDSRRYKRPRGATQKRRDWRVEPRARTQ